MQAVVALRTNRATNWAAAAWKPEGPGEFGPISSPRQNDPDLSYGALACHCPANRAHATPTEGYSGAVQTRSALLPELCSKLAKWSPKHFPAKWTPVRRGKCDQTKI